MDIAKELRAQDAFLTGTRMPVAEFDGRFYRIRTIDEPTGKVSWARRST
jgi:hypothetical protein